MLIPGHRHYLYVSTSVSAPGLSNACNVPASGPVPPVFVLSANVPNFPATGPVGDHAVVKHAHLGVHSISRAYALTQYS